LGSGQELSDGIQELWTAARYHIPVTFVDIEGMARSLGVEALCVTEPDARTAAVAGSFCRSAPLLLEVSIER